LAVMIRARCCVLGLRHPPACAGSIPCKVADRGRCRPGAKLGSALATHQLKPSFALACRGLLPFSFVPFIEHHGVKGANSALAAFAAARHGERFGGG